MTISLTPELQRFVDKKVKAGDFASADEAVNKLLSFVVAQDELSAAELEELRDKVAIGIEQADQGLLEEWDPDDIWAEVERRDAQLREKRAE